MEDVIRNSFHGDTKAFLLGELEDLGATAVTASLEAVLMVASGEMVSEGATDEMRDGTVAAKVRTADMVAIVLGHASPSPDADVVAALKFHSEDLRATKGPADLAARAIACVEDAKIPYYAGRKGTFASVAEFQAVVAEVQARVGDALADHPGTWAYEPVGPGAFAINRNSEAMEASTT